MSRRPDPEDLNGRELTDQALADSGDADVALGRGIRLVAVVGVVFVLLVVAGGVVFNRAYPPPSPPNTATQQELNDLRSDLDQYLAGRGGLRDQQYAKTVYTLCQLARDTGNADVLDDYDCAAVLAAPSPEVSTSSPTMTLPGASPRSSTTRPSAAAPAASSSATPPASTSSPTASSPARTTAAPSTPAPVPTPTPLLSGVLCTLPILTLCPGGSP